MKQAIGKVKEPLSYESKEIYNALIKQILKQEKIEELVSESLKNLEGIKEKCIKGLQQGIQILNKELDKSGAME